MKLSFIFHFYVLTFYIFEFLLINAFQCLPFVSIPRNSVANNPIKAKIKKNKSPYPSPRTATSSGNPTRPSMAPILETEVPPPWPVERIDVGYNSCGKTKSVLPGPHVCVSSKTI